MFKDIMQIKQVIKDLGKEIENLKNSQISFYKKRYESFKTLNTKQSIQYDLIYCALFGNGIFI